MTPHHAAMAPAPAARASKFGFWSSMADLVRLVLRSRAPRLKSRLGVALGTFDFLRGRWGVPPAVVRRRSDVGQRLED